jgi:hypothetical protein
MTIHITQQDIDDSPLMDRWPSPIGKALTRATGLQVEVGFADLILLTKNRFKGRHKLPKEVADWLDRFDRGDKVDPISFELSVDKP